MAPSAISPRPRSSTGDGRKPHVLICSTSFTGHYEKLRAIAVALVKEGYKVTIMTGSTLRQRSEETGARFYPVRGLADYDGQNIDQHWPERRLVPAGSQHLCFDLSNLFIEPMVGQYEAVQAFLAEETAQSDDPIVIIQDIFFMGVLPLYLGAPGRKPAGFVNIGICPLLATSIDTAPFNSGLPPDSSPQGRVRNAAGNEMFRQMLAGPQKDFVRKVGELGATSTNGFVLDLLISLPDRFLQLCIPELEYVRSDLPKSVRYIGALPSGSNATAALPSWWHEISKGAKRTVVVTQGTVTNDPHELIIPTLEALKDFDVIVVALLVRSERIENYEPPPNARFAQYIPYVELFKHADLVISSGGYGSIQQAFEAGVPMVLAGTTEDKPEGNARAAWTGAAINLATGTPKVSQVRQAVDTVLHNRNFKMKALKLQAKYRATDSIRDIAATVDELASRR